MKYLHRRICSVAGLLTIAGAAQAAGQSNEDLQRQIEELKAVVKTLQQQIGTRPAVAAKAANTNGESAQSSASAEKTVIGPAGAAGAGADAGTDTVAGTPDLAANSATETPTETATKADIDGLRTDLENYKYEQKRNRETKTALTTRGTTIGGSVQARATAQSTPVKTGSTSTSSDRYSSFDIPQATLNFAGSLYRDYSEGRNLDYRLAFAYAKNSPGTDGSQLNATDAYIRYSPFPTLTGLEDPRLTITLGQQQIPFGLEAQIGEELRPVINNALFLGGLGVGTRQIGLIVRGDYDPYVDYGFNYRAPLLEYAFGVVNGAGPNKSDDNNHKDYIARVAFTLPVDYYSVFRELKFGLSAYKGQKNLTAGTAATVVGQGKRDRYGFDIYYNHAPFGVTYEYAEGRDGTVNNGPDIKSRGQYLTAFYTWGEQWIASSRAQAKYDDYWPKSYQLFARYDTFDPNRALGNDKTKAAILGFNLFFAETTKFQLNLNHYDYQNPAQRSANELLAQFQFGF
ncbi:DUF3138 domain-containing protein [Massilia dura]|uniref:DUF3138 domain-containing protein n=1 Tax=Pseudoduganella dura TaxID=321982 RepID=A0A6I3XIK8_9BURK|nr:DUF3138 domain-containing protein [Pseudoduganella dura]MUI13481.1 DUF3138 domain-containing protein [Pseudoduganella dura]GGX83065.1 hypothetical protein GCM10007386_12400 [Pseudoduganella dura]